MATITRQMSKRFDQSVAELGVTRSQWSLIAVVGRYPGATQRIIADALDITEASAGRLIDRLCNDGILVRRPHEEDRRAYSVHLTESAKPLLIKLSEFAHANEDEAFAGVTDDELEQMTTLLDRIYANMGVPRIKAPS